MERFEERMGEMVDMCIGVQYVHQC